MRGIVALTLFAFVGACSAPETTSQGRCGDGLQSAGEACDDGNSVDEDACSNACEQATCGDGIVRQDLEPGTVGAEGCDDHSSPRSRAPPLGHRMTPPTPNKPIKSVEPVDASIISKDDP